MGAKSSKTAVAPAQGGPSPGPNGHSSSIEPPRVGAFSFLPSVHGLPPVTGSTSSIEPPRVPRYSFIGSPAAWPGPVSATATTDLVPIVEEHETVDRGAAVSQSLYQPQPTRLPQPPPSREPARPSSYDTPSPPPSAPDVNQTASSPGGATLPLSLLLESTGRSWPNHVQVESEDQTWSVPDTGPFPPLVYNRRAEEARYARRYPTPDTGTLAGLTAGVAHELDIVRSGGDAESDAPSVRPHTQQPANEMSPSGQNGQGNLEFSSVDVAVSTIPALVVTHPVPDRTGRGLPLPAAQYPDAVRPGAPLHEGCLLPPVSNMPMATPELRPEEIARIDSPVVIPPSTGLSGTAAPAIYYNTNKPTCSLNLVCYRSGSRGADLQQIHCILQTLCPDEESFQKAVAVQPHLVYTDKRFFREMNNLYTRKMCGTFRRHFSLKTLRAFRILAYTPTTRPTVVPFDDFVLQEMLYAYRNPDRLPHGQDWIRWVFRLRRTDRRHALEFVEGWDTTRIAVAGTAPWLSSVLVGVVWSVLGGDAQTAFTVASFILTSSSSESASKTVPEACGGLGGWCLTGVLAVILALLAVISSIESSGGLVGTRG